MATDPLMRVSTAGTEARGKNYSDNPATPGLVLTSTGPDGIPTWTAIPPPTDRVLGVPDFATVHNDPGTLPGIAPYIEIARAGIFLWDATSLAAGDDVEVVEIVALAGGPGRYLRIDSLFVRTETSDAVALGLQLPPGCEGVAGVWNVFHGTHSLVDLALNSNGLKSALPVVLGTMKGTPLAPSSRYTVTIGARVTIWETATPANVGSIDIVVDAYITTNGANVATVALQTTPNPDLSRLPVALLGATASIAPSAGGFTLQAARPTGLACTCRAKWWSETFEVLP